MTRKKKKILFGSIGAGVLALVAVIAIVIGVNSNKDGKGTGEIEVVDVDGGGKDNGKENMANQDTLDRPVAPEETTDDLSDVVNLDNVEYEVGKVKGHWSTSSGVKIDIIEREDGTIDGTSGLWGIQASGNVETDNKSFIKIKKPDDSTLNIKIVKMSDDINNMFMELSLEGQDGTLLVFPYKAYDVPDSVKREIRDGLFDIEQGPDVLQEGDEGYIEVNPDDYRQDPVEDEGEQPVEGDGEQPVAEDTPVEGEQPVE